MAARNSVPGFPPHEWGAIRGGIERSAPLLQPLSAQGRAMPKQSSLLDAVDQLQRAGYF